MSWTRYVATKCGPVSSVTVSLDLSGLVHCQADSVVVLDDRERWCGQGFRGGPTRGHDFVGNQEVRVQNRRVVELGSHYDAHRAKLE